MSPYLRKIFKGGKKRLLLLLATAFMLAFIWSQSILPTNESAGESRWFTDNIINPVLGIFGIHVTDSFTRKLAHALEFTVMSILASLLWNCHPVRSIYCGFTIAFLDETIQVFAKRGPMITDVWIDLIGVVSGFVIAFFLSRIKPKAHGSIKWQDGQ